MASFFDWEREGLGGGPVFGFMDSADWGGMGKRSICSEVTIFRDFDVCECVESSYGFSWA